MIYVLIGMSLLFISIGYIVTENNASYLLSGYNTLSDKEREKFDLSSYIPHFRKFHLFLGISFFFFGLFILFFNKDAAGIFLGIYPVLAYIYFIWSTRKYTKAVNKNKSKVAILIGLGTLIFVIGVFSIGYQENKLLLHSGKIEITGIYGEELRPADIASVSLTHQLPVITLRTNGFASGTVRKGYFATNEGEEIKLLLNSDDKPFICITKKSGKKIFYSANSNTNAATYQAIKKTLPNLGN